MNIHIHIRPNIRIFSIRMRALTATQSVESCDWTVLAHSANKLWDLHVESTSKQSRSYMRMWTVDAGSSLIKTTVSLNLRRGRASPVLATGQGKPCTCDGTGQVLYLRRDRASPVLATGQGKPCTCDGTGQAQGRAGTCDIIGHDWNLGIEHSRRKWSRVIRGGGPSNFTYNQ